MTGRRQFETVDRGRREPGPGQAYEQMISGDARFRVVLDTRK